MTDMTAALRILADTQGAEAGLRKLADQLRAMGADQREAAAAGAQAAAETGAAWADAGTRAGGAMEAAGSEAAALAAELAALGPLDLAVDVSGLEAARAQIDGVIDQMEAAARTAGIEVGVDVDLSALEAARAQVATAFEALEAAVHVDADASAVQTAAREAVAALASIEDAAARIKPVIRADVDTSGIQQAGDALDETAAATARAEAEAQEYQRALDQVRARFNPLFAASQQYEQELKDIAAAERLGAISATEAAAARERASRILTPMTQDLRALGTTTQLSSASLGNLVAQFNDVGVMLMAGQNPLQLAIQQGTQITQVIGPMGAAGAVRALGAAFVGMLNPINLVTIGGLAAGAALVNWLTSASEKALTLDEAMGDLSARLKSYEQAAKAAGRSTAELRGEFGGAADEARILLREIAQMERGAAASAVATATQTLREQMGVYDARDRAWVGNQAALADMFNLSRFGRGREGRQRLIGAVEAGFSAVDAAAGIADESARIDAMADAAQRLRDAFVKAADADGQRTVAEKDILATLNQQVIAALRLKEIKDADLEQERARLMQWGGRGPKPLTPEQREVRDTEAELQAEAQMAALITQHGRESLEVARARAEAERDVFQAKMETVVSSGPELDRIMALWDASRGVAALERDREAQARAMLATLESEAAMQQAVARYGADSAQVAGLRVQQERQAAAALISTLVPAGDLRDRLLAAWENARGLGATDMAGGLSAAAAQARTIADELARALGNARSLALAAISSEEEAEIRWRLRADPVAAEKELAGLRFDRTTAVPTVIDEADAAWLTEQRDATVASAGRRATFQQQLAAWQKEKNKGGRGGGGAKGDTLAGLSKEAQELLRELDIAAGAVAEKVRAGMISVAEGQDEMASAKERAAGQLAELIARLERLGPAGKAAAEAARKELADLAGQAGRTGEEIRKSLIESFEENFARTLATGKNAMSAFADHVQMELARAFTNKFITPMVSPLINAITGLFAFADGGVPGAPGLAAHRNTVVDRPTFFAMPGGDLGLMGEAGAEAIMPLLAGPGGLGVRATAADGSQRLLPLQRAADGALGVALPSVGDMMRRATAFAMGGVMGRLSDPPRMGETPSGGGGFGRPNIVINNNNPAARVEARERHEAGGMTVEVLVEQLESALADRMGRGVGPLSGVLGNSFGLGRVGR